MISFLILIEKSGLVNEIKWSFPAYIISIKDYAFLELFSEVQRGELLKEINRNTDARQDFFCIRGLLQIDSQDISLNCLAIEDKLLVFGSDLELSGREPFAQEFAAIIRKFMTVVKEHYRDEVVYDKNLVQGHFESIQKINNELINTRRLLEKSNALLKIQNIDLNNRLVKDSLTGLVSRYQYRTEIEYFISSNPGKLGIFTFIDIDDFKAVNDSYGHYIGDRYLIEFSQRLKNLPLADTVRLRISGDEFGLFTYGLDSATGEKMEEIWDTIRNNVMSRPIEIEGRFFPLSVSAGMAVYGLDTLEIYELIEYADFAMYVSKKLGKSRCSIFNLTEYQLAKGANY